jgi:hypothetical protein
MTARTRLTIPQRFTRAIIFAIVATAFGTTFERSNAQTLGTSTIVIQYPDGTSNSYNVPVTPGMTVEKAMKVASVMSPSFKWTSIWYGSLGSYQ